MSATTGGPPLAWVGADVALIVTFRAIVGSRLASVMVPFTLKLIRVDSPAGVALAERMAARREPGPELFRLLTVSVCVDIGAWRVKAWATAEPAGRATAAETPAIKLMAPTIRGMNRPVRIIRILMKTTCIARENIISPTSFFVFRDAELQLKRCVVSTR